MKVTADREVCVGAGMCVLTAPDLFDQDEDDGRVRVLVPEPAGARQEAAREAERLCPSRAVRVAGPAPAPPDDPGT
ncbi:ferredoxin [Nocardiopsis sp. RSe5-2]|uniref:Ferredoxin n=1 Tax=Nocardiopsis endophytica TaxID=3018445 RepID=A0ABT4U396_9ACTN|nr:ferredoxin [Nocardiopsis endophytica]MDA2811426.1 ferredoxin [Nocardiopsis endophytica]